ncbi:hypothetical protein R1sor_001844 [Riccia sorocarpa]|uniref:Cation efflux protein cytoplasmic domain-containing protein n=1 Tax=Riccia sorocarpa TaxID=122646 RepID=A0ABD3GX27_9MARC
MALSSGRLKTPAKLLTLRHILPSLSSISSRDPHPGINDGVSLPSSSSTSSNNSSQFRSHDAHFTGKLVREEEDDESKLSPSAQWMNSQRSFGQTQFLGGSYSGLVGALRSRKFGTSARGSLRELGVGNEFRLWRQGKSELVRAPVFLEFRRGHMGHGHHHQQGTPGQHDNTGKAGERVLRLGLWSDILLSVGKGAAGYVSGSTAIIADAAHSVSDIALSGVALWSSKVAMAPKDKEHPYGHGKFENLGALCISVVLLLTGGGIAWHAVDTLQAYAPFVSEMVNSATEDVHQHGHEAGGHHHGIDLEHPYVALSAAVVSIVVKEVLYWQTKFIGEKQKSELLKASAWHHRSDAISSVVALIGVGGALLGMPLLDPVAGLLVSGMIIKAGMETGYQSLQDLVDIGAPESVLSPIRSTVLQVPGVEGCHHLRGRRMGSFLHVDAHLEVDPWLSVSAAYQIGQAVRQQVQKEHPEVAETFVHIEPADGGSKTLTDEEAEKEAHHHDPAEDDIHAHGNSQHQFRKSDRTKNGSKSDLLGDTTLLDEESDPTPGGDSRQPSEVEQDVRRVVSSNFTEEMTLTHVTSHYLKGRVVVEVEVLMNPDISVRDAMAYAHDAEELILREIKDISAVDIQLKLSKSKTQSIPSP